MLNGFPLQSLRYTSAMEIQVSASVEAKLKERATREGREPGAVAARLLEEVLEYDAWYLEEVDKGLAEAEAGDLIPHGQVVAHVEELLAGYRAKAS